MAKLAIRVKVFDRSEYVEITGEMLSDSEKFLRHVLQSFELDPSQAAQAYIFDQNNFRIPVDLYPVVMPQFLNSAVYIKLVFTLDENTGFDLTLEDFLKQNGCKAILLAAKQAHQLNEELHCIDMVGKTKISDTLSTNSVEKTRFDRNLVPNCQCF